MTSGGGEFFLLLPSLFFSREVFANFHADAVWVRWAWERTRRKLSTGNVENSENRFPLSLLSAMKNYSSDWKLGERMNSLSTFSRGRERELFTLKCGYRRRRFFRIWRRCCCCWAEKEERKISSHFQGETSCGNWDTQKSQRDRSARSLFLFSKDFPFMFCSLYFHHFSCLFSSEYITELFFINFILSHFYLCLPHWWEFCLKIMKLVIILFSC